MPNGSPKRDRNVGVRMTERVERALEAFAAPYHWTKSFAGSLIIESVLLGVELPPDVDLEVKIRVLKQRLALAEAELRALRQNLNLPEARETEWVNESRLPKA